MASTATTTAPAPASAGSSASPTTSTRVDVALGRDGRVRLAGLARARSGPFPLRDVRPAATPARPAPVAIPERLADPVDVLAARLAVSSRPQPDGWRRDVLLYAMLVDAANTVEKGRPRSAAVVLGTHEAADRLRKREGSQTKTTGRKARPDNTSLRRSLVRLERCGLIARQIVRDDEDQERWTVATLLPLPAAVDELADHAAQLLGRWLDERATSWTTPLRRLARRRAENAARTDARGQARQALAVAELEAARKRVGGAPQTEGASPCWGSGLKATAVSPNRAGEKKENAGASRRASTKNECSEERGGEADVQVNRLTVAVRPLLAPLAASEADRMGNGGLGWLTRSERLRWARTVERWEQFRHIAENGWADVDAYQAAVWTMHELTAGGTRPLNRNSHLLTRDERDGVRRPRPLAIVARAMHLLTRDLAAIAKERRQREQLRTVAAAAIQIPVWVATDRAGRARWRTSTNHIVLIARWLPTDLELEAAAPTLRAIIAAHPSPFHGQIPTSLGVVDGAGDYARVPLRRARGSREDRAPRRPLRRPTRRRGA